MAYTTFSQTKNDQLLEPMFFGQPVNVARYDQQKYDIFEKLIEKQLSFFWRPEEVDVSRDRIDYQALPEHEKHIFISNLKYQTLLVGDDVVEHGRRVVDDVADDVSVRTRVNGLGEGPGFYPGLQLRDGDQRQQRHIRATALDGVEQRLVLQVADENMFFVFRQRRSGNGGNRRRVQAGVL